MSRRRGNVKQRGEGRKEGGREGGKRGVGREEIGEESEEEEGSMEVGRCILTPRRGRSLCSW